jgi:hypothetical protein
MLAVSSLDSTTWVGNVAWGVPLIVGNVLIHVVGLNLIGLCVLGECGILRRRNDFLDFVLIVGITALLTISLHALEGAIWGAAYLLLGALNNKKAAMLYSLGAMTTYGHANIHLSPYWELLGAMEALQGMLLFGLTTAFLFAVFHAVTPLKNYRSGTWVTERVRTR